MAGKRRRQPAGRQPGKGRVVGGMTADSATVARVESMNKLLELRERLSRDEGYPVAAFLFKVMVEVAKQDKEWGGGDAPDGMVAGWDVHVRAAARAGVPMKTILERNPHVDLGPDPPSVRELQAMIAEACILGYLFANLQETCTEREVLNAAATLVYRLVWENWSPDLEFRRTDAPDDSDSWKTGTLKPMT